MTEDRLPLAELLAKAGDGDFLRSVVEAVVQLLMETDVDGLIGAGRHERSGDRTTYRNGYRDRTLDTRLGSLQLRIPKLRQGSYFPPFLEPRKTSEKALVAVIQEAWVSGVSTRRVDDLVQAMGLAGISKSTVSKLCKDIDERVGAFLDRPLTGDWPYLWLDATYLKQREGGRIVSVAAIIAVAANTDGKREIVGLHIGPSEAETFWAIFLKSMARRGLRGIKLVISDAHEGLKAAIRRVMGASWQRCRVHWMRNALAYVSKGQQSMVSAALRQAFIQPDRTSASQTLRHVADQLRSKWPKLGTFIDESEIDVLAHMDFPTQHRSKIHSTNPLERLNKMGYPAWLACGGPVTAPAMMPRVGGATMFYVGLDVSVGRTAVCIMDALGQVVHEQSVTSTPEAIATAIKAAGLTIERVGLEAGINSAWLARGLLEAELPAIVIDATHAAAALKTGFRNKTDKNDARGIADLMRVNKFRPVWVKSAAAQRDRALLTVREQLRRQALDARNTIWSILQVEGLKPPKLSSPAFQVLVVQSLEDQAIAPLLQPLVAVAEHLDHQVAGLDKLIAARAKASAACQRLMTVPGVGPLVALTYAAGVDDPARFGCSRNVGAHFGLTPRRFQSGETDWSGGISRAGDAGVRRALYQAANVLIHHSRRWCALKSWAVRLAKRRGLGKAKVALARKLAVVLHRIWTTGEDYKLKAAI